SSPRKKERPLTRLPQSSPLTERICAEAGDKLAQAFPPPCELRRNFPHVADERSTGSVRSVWEHMFLSPANRGERTCAKPPYPQGKTEWKTEVEGGSLRTRDTCRPARRSRPDRAAPEPRGRGIRPRGDAALPGRDRGGERGPRRRGLLPREPREDLPCRPRALREGRAGGCNHARRRARGARRNGRCWRSRSPGGACRRRAG